MTAPDVPVRALCPAVDLAALAARVGVAAEHVIPYGRDVAKIDLAALGPGTPQDPADQGAGRPDLRYVVVTAITPTPFGEGKTTTAIGLAQALVRRGERATLTLRQGAMGPTFGGEGRPAAGPARSSPPSA